MKRRWFDPITGTPGRWDAEAGEHRRSDTPVPAGSVISQLVDHRKWRHRLEGSQIHDVWVTVAGEAVAAHVQPVRLLGGVLVLAADSGAWATQVRYLQQSLIERANAELGRPLVERIQITSVGRRR